MRLRGETGFVLHARPWRDASLLVDVLSAGQGRIGLVARGLGGPKRHPLRAALQPWQHIRFDADWRGELGSLRAAEAMDAGPRLQGDAALSGFYVHELLLRLLPRHDPQPAVLAQYASLRERLAAGEAPAWPLRLFERDLLESLGVAPPWDCDALGEPLDPLQRYQMDPEAGARHATRGGVRGSAWLALAEGEMPPPTDLADLRLAMRDLIAHHLGGKPLAAWSLFSELAQVRSSR